MNGKHFSNRWKFTITTFYIIFNSFLYKHACKYFQAVIINILIPWRIIKNLCNLFKCFRGVYWVTGSWDICVPKHHSRSINILDVSPMFINFSKYKSTNSESCLSLWIISKHVKKAFLLLNFGPFSGGICEKDIFLFRKRLHSSICFTL